VLRSPYRDKVVNCLCAFFVPLRTVLRSFRGLFITKAPASYKGISWESAAKVYNAAAKMESDYR
jgi:hypothetical protein